jgi:hypothetical protein
LFTKHVTNKIVFDFIAGLCRKVSALNVSYRYTGLTGWSWWSLKLLWVDVSGMQGCYWLISQACKATSHKLVLLGCWLLLAGLVEQ